MWYYLCENIWIDYSQCLLQMSDCENDNADMREYQHNYDI